ncbi:MAG: hypothetical protein Tsb0020_39650 [Haliangiales bacterium]
MKKPNTTRTSKKLSLAKSTLRQLSKTQLGQAEGGTARLTTQCTSGCTDTD